MCISSLSQHLSLSADIDSYVDYFYVFMVRAGVVKLGALSQVLLEDYFYIILLPLKCPLQLGPGDLSL